MGFVRFWYKIVSTEEGIAILRLKLRENGKIRNNGGVKVKKRCEAVLKDTGIMGKFIISHKEL